MTTLIIHHDACLAHDPGPQHPESPARLKAVLGALEELPHTERLPAPLATTEAIERAHPGDYWRAIVAAGPADDRVALDPDTLLSPGSIDAALRGAGAACFAVEQVLGGRAQNAFCAVRPPGHHAEADRAMGFCLLNNAAIAARHAQAACGLERIAILDFDVHHGNGTQAIFESSPDVLYVSSHQVPLYPGTGSADEVGQGNILNLPLSPGSGSREFRRAWTQSGLPALHAFRPEFIIFSAGFDAHALDPLGQIELVEDDFTWITTAVREYAEQQCAGGLISILEGGYHLDALAASAAAHVAALTN
ncbi:histone deacetylase family protein [Elongatibacter sediminis]|uniref:Histone deacetylase family protein n=1 Tax=Elongatibacter sediminis TaxID=3119006 RepID=A0AAW9REM9_9GAMM